MSKKQIITTQDLTWNGTEEIWSETSYLWTDDVITIVEYIIRGGSRGGVRKQFDTWNAWDKINNKNKQKIVKVIVYLKTGVKLESKIDVNKYKITIEDINLLIEEYKKYKVSVENVKVK